jgi:hypothetical protein
MAGKKMELYRNNTTHCTRLNPEDRRTPRGRAFREMTPRFGPVGEISKDASKYGRRAYDRGDPS